MQQNNVSLAQAAGDLDPESLSPAFLAYLQTGVQNALLDDAEAGTLSAGSSMDDDEGHNANLPDWQVLGDALSVVVDDGTWPGGHYVQTNCYGIGVERQGTLLSALIPVVPGSSIQPVMFHGYSVAAGTTLWWGITEHMYDAAGTYLGVGSNYLGSVAGAASLVGATWTDTVPFLVGDYERFVRIQVDTYQSGAFSDATYHRFGYVRLWQSPTDPVLNGNATITGRAVAGEGMTTYYKAGTISDADFTATPGNGHTGMDGTNHRWYFREGGAWHYVTRTAGFEIPAQETTCPVCLAPLLEGDDVVGTLNDTYSDGALHGVWIHYKCGRNANHPKVGHGKDDD